MRLIKTGLVLLSGVVILGFLKDKLFARTKAPLKSFYEFQLTTLEGATFDFQTLRGKKVLIVNTASKCGYTPQYGELQKLHEQYGDKLVILGFPANNFLWQEPGSNEEIATFCERNYGVTFTMFEKVSVKGRDQHPLYQWLQATSGKAPSWNFCKYLISEEGKVLGFFGPKTGPLDTEITSKL